MNTELKNYLTVIQFNRICKYWRIFESLKYKFENFDNSKYMDWDEYTDEETIIECIKNNKRVDYRYDHLMWKMEYYEREYVNYIKEIGFELGDAKQDEILFNLLNNGIVIDVDA